jgi:hypothetical protein
MMSNATIRPKRRAPTPRPRDLTLEEALERVDDSTLAESLSVFFAHLARARATDDKNLAREVNRAILEVLRGAPEGPIDEPLMQAIRRRDRRKQHRATLKARDG